MYSWLASRRCPSKKSSHSRACRRLPWAVGACVWSRRGELEDPSLKTLTSRPLAFLSGLWTHVLRRQSLSAPAKRNSSWHRFSPLPFSALLCAALPSPFRARCSLLSCYCRISGPARPRILLLLLVLGLPVSRTRIYCPITHGTLSWPGLAPSSTPSHPLVCGLRAIISH